MPGDNNAQTKPKTVQTAVLNEPKKEVKTPVKEPVKQVEVKPNIEPKTIKEEPKKVAVKEPKIILEEPKKVDYTLGLKNAFSKVEILCREMYDNVFSKNAQFRPTFNETIYNALAYLGYKCSTVNAKQEFELAFDGVDILKISEPFVPYIIKLSTWYDKKFNKDITQKILFEFNEFFKVLSKNLDFNELDNFIKNN